MPSPDDVRLGHRKHSNASDVGSPNSVLISDWNDSHVLAGGTDGQTLVRDSTRADGAKWAELSYRHVQASAATVWDITHNLPFRPNVWAVDSSGREMVPGSVEYVSPVAVRLTFSAAVGGEAFLS